ncbi:siderophore-interacting protein [Rhodococcus sp. SJ-2]|nr:siderophore-interacting protein [Rhodococcus sp. (in: high G+C Gram-positive bacteria)]
MSADSGPAVTEERREIELIMHDLTPRVLKVVRVENLSRTMRRVVVGGAALQGFPYVTMAPDDHVKLFFPDATTGRIAMPEIGPDGMRIPAQGPRPEARDYTVRAFDRESLELTMDFVLHSHGIAGTWASKATPGDEVGVLGPRGSHVYPTGYDWYLLVADETALPALCRWIEELPSDTRVVAFAEVADEHSELIASGRDGVELTYLHRHSAEPGTTTLLADAVRACEFPDGEMFAWVAGEAGSIKPIRSYLTRELGLARGRAKVDGYWRLGKADHDHHEVIEEDD